MPVTAHAAPRFLCRHPSRVDWYWQTADGSATTVCLGVWRILLNAAGHGVLDVIPCGAAPRQCAGHERDTDTFH